MRVLVTGGAGFVGTNLIKRLLKDGHEVVSVDNYSTGKKEYEQDGCRYYNFDLSVGTPQFWTFNESNFDVIYHLAAKARIVPSIQNPKKSLFNNNNSTINVLEYARQNNTPVVYAGSSSAHGDVYANPYTFSKWNGEKLCRLYSNVYDLPTVICRFYNVYGEYQLTDGAYCTVLGIFERQYREGKALTVTGDGEQRRDFTYVGDIVDGLIKCMEAMHGAVDMRYAGEIFELGNGKNYSILDLVEAFGETEVEYLPPRPGEIRESLNTDNKARDTLGWVPKGDIIDYIKKSIVS